MTKSWQTARAEAVARGQITEEGAAKARTRLLAESRAYRLAELRQALGLNQVELAERIGVSQSRISRIESGDLDHTEIATLRAFAAALGGELEIGVRLGDERVVVG